MEQNPNADDDGFVKVGKSGRVKKSWAKTQTNKTPNKNNNVNALNKVHEKNVGPSKENILKKLELARDDLHCSDYSKLMLKVVLDRTRVTKDKRIKVICYGLGNFGTSMQARYQLTLLQMMVAAIEQQTKAASVDVFDPYFTTNEELVIKHIGFNVQTHNEQGQYKTDCTTLFYMPHCSLQLYNNVLFANWTKEQLSRVSILGNSFTNYAENAIGNQLTESAW